MAKFTVLKRAIHGVPVGGEVELSEDQAKARGDNYLKASKKVVEKKVEEKKVENKGSPKKAANKGL